MDGGAAATVRLPVLVPSHPGQLASTTCDRKEQCTSDKAADVSLSNLASARALAIQQGYVFAGVRPNASDIKRANLGGRLSSASQDLRAR